MLDVSHVSLHFGGVKALDDLSFTVPEGGICALIGPNGAGKTTLFNVVSRVYTPSQGSVRLSGVDLLDRPRHQVLRLGIARTFQNLALWPTMTVRENVMVGAHIHAKATVLTSALRLGTRSEQRRLSEAADAVLDSVGILEHADHPAADLPFGTLKRVELARALISKPRLLLLDEPAGGLTHTEVDHLADLIRDIAEDRALTVLLVEHHMGMVMRLARQVVVLDAGTKIADGSPNEVREDPRVIAAYLGAPA